MQKLSICLRHELRRPITSFLLYVIGQRVMGLVKNQREEKQKWRVHTEREGSDSNRLWKLSLNRYSIDICGINRRMTYQKVHTWSEAEWKRREIQVSWHLSLCCWVSVEGWRHWSSSSCWGWGFSTFLPLSALEVAVCWFVAMPLPGRNDYPIFHVGTLRLREVKKRKELM